MRLYQMERFLRRTMIAVPVPGWITRLARLYVHTKAGENFGDMRIIRVSSRNDCRNR